VDPYAEETQGAVRPVREVWRLLECLMQLGGAGEEGEGGKGLWEVDVRQGRSVGDDEVMGVIEVSRQKAQRGEARRADILAVSTAFACALAE
jgi:hypothetical protein